MSASKTSDYALVAMLEPQEVGLRFSEWPLHVTLLPWFSAPNLSSVVALCEQVAQKFSPFSLAVGERAYFGYNRDLPVRLLEKNDEISQLHRALLLGVSERGWVQQGRYTGDQYRPHVTRHRGRDAEGQITVAAIYVVEKLPQGYRKIVAKVDL